MSALLLAPFQYVTQRQRHHHRQRQPDPGCHEVLAADEVLLKAEAVVDAVVDAL